MNGKDLLTVLGDVDLKYFDEVEQDTADIHSHRNKGRLITFIVVAAVLSLMGMTALAAQYGFSDTPWFSLFFSEQPESETTAVLSDNQKAILDRGLVAINQSVTDNGYTITLESGISDGYRMLLKYRIDAPEGVLLDTDNFRYSLDYTTDILPPSVGKPEAFGVGYSTYSVLEDGNANDHSIGILFECDILPPEGADFSITDGTVWTITFHNIQEEKRNSTEKPITLCEGTWEFRITFSNDFMVTQSVELLAKPLRCSAVRDWGDHRFPVRVTVTSLKLRTLTATICYKKPLTGFWEGILLDPISLIMKDGSRIEARFRMTYFQGNYAVCAYTFDRPVSVDDVAYIDFQTDGVLAVSTAERNPYN